MDENDRNTQYKSSKCKNHNSTVGLIKKILLVLFLVCCIAVTSVLIGIYFTISTIAENSKDLVVELSLYSSTIGVDEIGENYPTLNVRENIAYVTLDTLPTYVGGAFIATEDEKFYEHNGVDIRELTQMSLYFITDRYMQTESTITQQLVKNLRGARKSAVTTQFEEYYIAIQYEKNLKKIYRSKKVTKDKILEIYLNSMSFDASYDNTTHYLGIQSASNYYFNKDASELTISETAVLAAIIQFPSKLNPIKNPEANRSRQVVVLQCMFDQGYITEAEYIEAINDDVYSRIAKKNGVEE